MANYDPKIKTTEYEYLYSQWEIVNTLIGGTRAMREAGTRYLIRHEKETEAGYQSRLARSYLFNGLEICANSLSSKPLKDSINLQEKNDQINALLASIYNNKDSLETFAFKVFREALMKGVAYALISGQENNNTTLQDDEENPVNPYLVFIPPEYVPVYDKDNGVVYLELPKKELTPTGEVLYKELIIYCNEVDEQGIERSVLQIYNNKDSNTMNYIETRPNQYEFGIPLYRFEIDVMSPPLLGLAYLNLTHWNSTSDQLNSTRIARFPILNYTGSREQSAEDTVISPYRIFNSGSTGTLSYVEHSGKALSVGADEITKLEAQMNAYGDQLISKRGYMTATEKMVDTTTSNSKLGIYTKLFESFLNEVLTDVFSLANISILPEVILATEFDLSDNRDTNLEVVTTATQNNFLSVRTYLEQLVALNVLPNNFDVDEELSRILIQQQDALDNFVLDLPVSSNDEEVEPEIENDS